VQGLADSADSLLDMSSVSKLAVLGLALAPWIGRAQTDAGPWRFIPPNAKALISVDWSRIRKSHVGTLLREKWVDGAGIPGTEFLDDADRFLISSTGRPADQPDAEAPMLIVVTGHFDLAKVRTALAQHRVKPQMYNSFQVYRQQGKDAKDLAFALLNPQTILIGDSRSVFASLDRSAFPAAEPAAGSLLTRVADMDSSYDAWAIVNTPDILGGDRLTALLSGSDSDVDARGFEFGVSLRNGLAADVSLMFGSDSVAKSMATELSRMVKLAVKGKLGDPALADLEKRLKFAAQGSVTKLTLRLSPQELEKNAQIFTASRKQPAAGVPEIRPVVKQDQPVAAKVEPPVPPKPEKKVIRIEGLDDGPREIPYQEDH
jgi:hypothetical protein